MTMCNDGFCNNRSYALSRRDMLKGVSCGFGMLAFSGIAQAMALRTMSQDNPLAPKDPHYAATAKRVIFLCMAGGPSHLDMFDYKPKLVADDGKALSSGRRRNAKLMGSPFKFSQHGESGTWFSELVPNIATHADRICMLNGMHTDIPAHAQAFVQMHTGSFQFVRPSLGAWTLYGLGTENENLPGFVTISPPGGNGGAQNYGSAFLPAINQGTRIGGVGRNAGRGDGGTQGAIPNIAQDRLTRAGQREQIDLVQKINEGSIRRGGDTEEIEGVIQSYELAFRMQDTLPRVLDIANIDQRTRDLYGLDAEATSGFGRQCLMARQLAENGVRFIEVGAGGWDHHRNLRQSMADSCESIDRPIAGLLTDLEERGMLEDTLVLYGGEFGRTPDAQNGDGRDHNAKGFTMWMAGGGAKGGLTHGSTDDYGAEAVDGRIHIHDWHATILHMLGMDHESLTYQHAGRDFRLTDVHGNIVREILA
ncbi:MAG: DUF1501 domain-containing protein [Phycisphaerales bacterium]|nr:DUF1501 domain-containing protein [Phycisphaerales bacterium]